MEPNLLLCSRNARPQKALVGRAHDGNPQALPLIMEVKMEMAFGKQSHLGIDRLPRKT